MKIAVVGTGYVGLVTGTCFAESGNDVICVDNNPNKIATLNDNRIPIYEPGLHELVLRNKREGRLCFHHRSTNGGSHFHDSFLSLLAHTQSEAGD